MQFVIGKWRGSSCIISSRCKFLRFFGIQSLFTLKVWQPLLSSIRVPSWLNRGSCSTSNLHLSLYIHFHVRSWHIMVHCIALHCPSVASRASNQELGQTNLLISQPSKQRNFSLNQGLGVCPTSSHGLEVYLKYFGQGLRAQRSAVHTQTVKSQRKSTVSQSSGWWSFLWNLGTMINNQEFIQLGTSFEVKFSRN